jgi:hypothetical protein
VEPGDDASLVDCQIVILIVVALAARLAAGAQQPGKPTRSCKELHGGA